MGEAQRNYFYALRDISRGKTVVEQTSVSMSSLLKYGILGSACGFVLAAGAVVMFYLCNGKIKTNDGLKERFTARVPDAIFIPQARRVLLKKLAGAVRDIDPESSDLNKRIALANISESVASLGSKRVFFAFDHIRVAAEINHRFISLDVFR